MIPSMGVPLIVLGIVVLWLGYRMGHSVRKAGFLRRNTYGIEEFTSYEEMVRTERSEKMSGGFGSFVRFMGVFLILGGVGNLMMGAALRANPHPGHSRQVPSVKKEHGKHRANRHAVGPS